MDAGHHDDLAERLGASHALLAELADRRLHGEERAGEIDGDHPVPVGLGEVGEVCVLLHSRVGNEDVDRAEGVDRGGEHRADLVLARDVCLEGEGAAAGSLAPGDGVVGAVLVGVVVDQHGGSGLCQSDGAPGADAGACPRDDCGLAGKVAVLWAHRSLHTVWREGPRLAAGPGPRLQGGVYGAKGNSRTVIGAAKLVISGAYQGSAPGMARPERQTAARCHLGEVRVTKPDFALRYRGGRCRWPAI